MPIKDKKNITLQRGIYDAHIKRVVIGNFNEATDYADVEIDLRGMSINKRIFFNTQPQCWTCKSIPQNSDADTCRCGGNINKPSQWKFTKLFKLTGTEGRPLPDNEDEVEYHEDDLMGKQIKVLAYTNDNGFIELFDFTNEDGADKLMARFIKYIDKKEAKSAAQQAAQSPQQGNTGTTSNPLPF